MIDLSERARELGEWLRGTESHVTEMAETAHRDGQRVLVEINSALAALFKSRAETVESLLAENERLSGLLSCAATGLAIACEGGVSNELLTQLWIDPHGLLSDITDALGHDPLQAEPESDPGLPAGSSP